MQPDLTMAAEGGHIVTLWKVLIFSQYISDYT